VAYTYLGNKAVVAYNKCTTDLRWGVCVGQWVITGVQWLVSVS